MNCSFFVNPAAKIGVTSLGDLMGHALEFYTKEYGEPAFGTRFVIAQTDDETMDAYAGPGMLFRFRSFLTPRGRRPKNAWNAKVAYQWGPVCRLETFRRRLGVAGPGRVSAFALRESKLTGAQLDATAARRAGTGANVRTDFVDRAGAIRPGRSISGLSVDRFLQRRDGLSHVARDHGKQQFSQLLRKFLEQYRNKSASIDDFERLTRRSRARTCATFLRSGLKARACLIQRRLPNNSHARRQIPHPRHRPAELDNLQMPVDVTLHPKAIRRPEPVSGGQERRL